uniref:Ovule protein n=1 Tax=Schistosoma curassoni TaxID=6186 RepID=A0A183KIG5_9TREM
NIVYTQIRKFHSSSYFHRFHLTAIFVKLAVVHQRMDHNLQSIHEYQPSLNLKV